MITPFLVQLLYGLLGPLNKAAITQVPFSFYVGVKLILAGLILLGYRLIIQRKSLYIEPQHRLYFLQIMLCGAIGAQYLKYWGLQYVSASKAAFLFNSSPFFVALFSWVRWRERLNYMQWVGLCISFVGLLPVLVTTTPLEQFIGTLGIFSLPELAILTASALHAVSFTAKRTMLHTLHAGTTQINGLYLLSGGIWSLGNWIIAGMPATEHMFITALGYGTLTTFIGKIVCSSLTLYLLHFYSATFLSFMEYWYPLCVAYWSWLLWGETVPYYYWLSACIILSGQCIFYLNHKK